MSETTTRDPAELALALGAGVWGVALAVAAPGVLRAVLEDPTRGEIAATRILGVRQVFQAIAQGARPEAATVVATGVDGVHALSMLGLAAVSRRHRRVALVSAATAGVFTLAGTLVLRRHADR